MKKTINILLSLLVLFSYFYLPINLIYAEEEAIWSAYTTASSSLTVHSTPATGNFNYVEDLPPYVSFKVIAKNGEFYKIIYGDNKEGWVEAKYVVNSNEFKEDSYGRPWNTPAKAIIGGTKVIAKNYIAVGQFTSYLKKFQVNPNASAGLYSHQYMTNIRAPWREARTSYKAYSPFLNEISFTFTIPVFNNMPDETTLSGMTNKGVAMTAKELAELLNDTEDSLEESTEPSNNPEDSSEEITETSGETEESANSSANTKNLAAEFEKELEEQKFPESYKKYLRSLHKDYPNWKFVALNTGLDWNTAVNKEIPKSCIEVSSGHGTNYGCGNESSSWAMADTASVKYFMDPRNFLDKESIFMFEDLSSYSNVTESMVQRILNGTFMSGKSESDNMNYATIFINAGKENNVNPVYLASLSLQEVGTNGAMQTSGESFEWYGLRYKSLYNFYNIGASGTFTAKGGLVWASGGSPTSYEFVNEIEIPSVEPEDPIGPEEPKPIDFDSLVINAGYKVDSNYIKNISLNTTVADLKAKFTDIEVTVLNKDNVTFTDEEKVTTGSTLTLKSGEHTYSKIIIISGDVDGDGNIFAADYVLIKNHIMEISKLDNIQKEASDMNANLQIDAGDYVLIKNHIMNS